MIQNPVVWWCVVAGLTSKSKSRSSRVMLTLLMVVDGGARQGRQGSKPLFVCLSVRMGNEWTKWWQRGQKGCSAVQERKGGREEGAPQGGGAEEGACGTKCKEEEEAANLPGVLPVLAAPRFLLERRVERGAEERWGTHLQRTDRFFMSDVTLSASQRVPGQVGKKIVRPAVTSKTTWKRCHVGNIDRGGVDSALRSSTSRPSRVCLALQDVSRSTQQAAVTQDTFQERLKL